MRADHQLGASPACRRPLGSGTDYWALCVEGGTRSREQQYSHSLAVAKVAGSRGVAIMEASTTANAGRIFISYRREETAWPAGWLFNRLEEYFGKGQVFKDVDSIRPGADFAKVITAAVVGCDVLLALIGDRWLTIVGEDGHRRLDAPDDFV